MSFFSLTCRWPLLTLGVLTLWGCEPEGVEGVTAQAVAAAYPLDQVLTLGDLQAEGTHNSYHQDSWFPVPSWQYTHAPLDEQMESQGVRQFELDIHFSARGQRFEVYHAPWIDADTSCSLLTDCLQVLKDWSDANPGHHPVVVLLETKDYTAPIDPADYANYLDNEVLSVWPEERLVTPAMVQGNYPTLVDAIRAEGWPTLGEVRGRLLLVLHDSGEIRTAYTHGDRDLEGRALFAESDTNLPYGAFLIWNDPYGQFDAIQQAVAEGFLVRTRADGDLQPSPEQLEMALASGAHFISTDFPALGTSEVYEVEIPGGNPSRCNPVTAPEQCVANDIENPEALSP